MAAEGKAIYVPGRCIEEVKAGGPVHVPQRPMPDYPDAISPIEAWEQPQAARDNPAKTHEQQGPAMINFSVTEDQYGMFEQAAGEAPQPAPHRPCPSGNHQLKSPPLLHSKACWPRLALPMAQPQPRFCVRCWPCSKPALQPPKTAP